MRRTQTSYALDLRSAVESQRAGKGATVITAAGLAVFFLLFWVGPSLAAIQPGSQESEAAPAALPVSGQDVLVTLQAKDLPLRELLEQISRAARVALIISSHVVATEKLSVDFRNFPADAALREVLRDYDAFYFYGAQDDSQLRLRIVWVYPHGKGSGLEPLPPEQWASTKEMRERLKNADPGLRASAIEALVQRLGDAASEEILNALRDADEPVRTMALHEALDAGVHIPDQTLVDLALYDTSPKVRFLALQAFSRREDMKWIAERALRDANPHVRAAAKQILGRWQRAAGAQRHPPQPSNQPPAQE